MSSVFEEQIKLVIWDLDETFWKGTLSDENVTLIEKNIKIVNELTNRGIVNSICSKNDFEKAKQKLEEIGIWEQFVFSSIDWTSKGERIKNIISDMNLRPKNVLFIDDNINNLKEAAFVCEGLQIKLPNFLDSLLEDDAFIGKDDSEHSRLKQYKILELKTAEREKSSSNIEFLRQSEIKVVMDEDCSDKLSRIYEMIHRNNQLNFTKDRISQEKVNCIFMDKNIKSGVVSVSDKYGDHGIVGCYAISNNKAIQFVFSCRILGMGVEQWVYSQLNYPEIEIVGDVASELKKDYVPDYINKKDNTITDKQNKCDIISESPRLIVYGYCPLRPVWAYIQPKLKNPKFAEISVTPPISNLGVLFRESEEQISYWVHNVKTFDIKHSFDKDILNGKFDFLLITLTNEMDGICKYTHKENSSIFYSKKLDKQTAHESILNEYTESEITIEDIRTELCFLCEHIPDNARILIQSISEVEFPSIKKDKNYYNRIVLNKLIEEISDKYTNITIIDIRKYAKLPTDFWEPTARHYNRAIGYSLANDVLREMNVINKKENENTIKADNTIPDNARKQVYNVASYQISSVTFIRNGLMYIHFSCDDENVRYIARLAHDRYFESEIEIKNSTETTVNINKPGAWGLFVKVFKDELEIGEFVTDRIDYNSINYFNYIDSESENYDNFKGSVNHFINDNITNQKIITDKLICINNLAAAGCDFSEWFIKNNITEINVFFSNALLCKSFMPYLLHSEVKVKYMFSSDMIMHITDDTDLKDIPIHGINDNVPIGSKDIVLYQGSVNSHFYKKLRATKARVIFFDEIISALQTKMFFINKLAQLTKDKKIKIMAVRTPHLSLESFSFSNSLYTPNERSAERIAKSALYLYKNIEKIYDSLPQMFKTIGLEKLKQTLIVPQRILPPGATTTRLKDCSGKYLNVQDGFRVTCNQPERFVGKIYLMGGTKVFGLCSADNETISSYLQELVNLPYKVINCSNYVYMDNMHASLRLLNEFEINDNDIIVFVLDNYVFEHSPIRYHWINWNELSSPIIKIDTYPLLSDPDREDFMLLPEAYTTTFNKIIAKKICEQIYRNINLF